KPQGGPGSASRLLGGTVAMVLILGVALAVFFLYRRQQKNQLGTDSDGTDLSPSQKLEPRPDSYLVPEDIQSLQLESARQQEQEEEPQKPPLQPPYYDLGVSPSYHPLVRMTEL
uniref:Uncharacterized protein n=1 Tax=Chinchilla lanigera TaxID=34839 RepID=A0A8C2YRI6_CHILA